MIGKPIGSPKFAGQRRGEPNKLWRAHEKSGFGTKVLSANKLTFLVNSPISASAAQFSTCASGLDAANARQLRNSILFFYAPTTIPALPPSEFEEDEYGEVHKAKFNMTSTRREAARSRRRAWPTPQPRTVCDGKTTDATPFGARAPPARRAVDSRARCATANMTDTSCHDAVSRVCDGKARFRSRASANTLGDQDAPPYAAR